MISLAEILFEALSTPSYAYKGNSYSGRPLYSVIDNSKVYPGLAVSGMPAYTIHNDRLYKGSYSSGTVLATLVGNKVYLGSNSSGAPLGTINGNYLYKGNSSSGQVIATSPSGCKYSLFAAAFALL